MLIWFAIIALLGLRGVAGDPRRDSADRDLHFVDLFLHGRTIIEIQVNGRSKREPG
jgi:hypothetical protein